MKDVVHKHFLLRAEVNNPLTNKNKGIKFLIRLIKKIKMQVMYGPVATYCKQEGNKGMTAFAIIETSHIVMHIWDENKPGLLQLDVYSCAPFDPKDVIDHINENFDVVKMDYKFIDRKTKFTEVKS